MRVPPAGRWVLPPTPRVSPSTASTGRYAFQFNSGATPPSRRKRDGRREGEGGCAHGYAGRRCSQAGSGQMALNPMASSAPSSSLGADTTQTPRLSLRFDTPAASQVLFATTHHLCQSASCVFPIESALNIPPAVHSSWGGVKVWVLAHPKLAAPSHRAHAAKHSATTPTPARDRRRSLSRSQRAAAAV